jgi:hypothetical protein
VLVPDGEVVRFRRGVAETILTSLYGGGDDELIDG